MSFTANYEVTKLGYFEEFTSQRGVEQGGNPLLTSVDCFATLAMTRTTAVLNSLGVRQPSLRGAEPSGATRQSIIDECGLLRCARNDVPVIPTSQ